MGSIELKEIVIPGVFVLRQPGIELFNCIVPATEMLRFGAVLPLGGGTIS